MPAKPTERPANGHPGAAARKRLHRSTISLPPQLRECLEARGARSDKGHGPYNYTRQLSRTLALFTSVVDKSDPRRTHQMADDDYELIVEVLTDPLALHSFHIVHLGDYLFDLPVFRTRTRELAVDSRKLCDLLNALPFAEKLHLVEAAQIRHAPPRPASDRR